MSQCVHRGGFFGGGGEVAGGIRCVDGERYWWVGCRLREEEQNREGPLFG